MSVPEQTPYKEYTGNGVTKNFALEFTCDSKQELKVFIDNVEPELSTWSLVGGSVVFTTAPASGSKIVLKRATKLERTTNYSSVNNSFQPEAINKDFDRVWYAIQDQNYKVGQYDFDYSYAINTSNQANEKSNQALQTANSALVNSENALVEARPISRGGTGATTAEDARTNLNIYSQAEVDALIATGGEGSVVGVSGGGTGGTTAAEARTNLGVPSTVEVAEAIDSATPPDATTTVKGVAKIATTASVQGGENDTDIITAKKLKGYLDTRVLGINQTWQEVTTERVGNTSYLNASKKPIQVVIKSSYNGDFQVSTDGLAWVWAGTVGSAPYGGASPETECVFAVVPPNHRYRLTSAFQNWSELK